MINIGGTGKFLPHILEIFALFMASGTASTLLLPETKGFSLENLSQEEQAPFIGGADEPLPVVSGQVPDDNDQHDKDLQQD